MPSMTLAALLPDALENLPWLVQIPVGLALMAGLALWLAGRRLIRPVTILIGLGVGGLLGFLVLPVLIPTLNISPYLGLLGGAACGLTVALLLYQVATAITFGSAIGAGCGVAAAAVLGTALTLPASAQFESAALTVQQPDIPGQIGGGEQPVYIPPPARWDPRVEPLPEPYRGPEGADVENPGVIRGKPVVTKPRTVTPTREGKPTTVKRPASGEADQRAKGGNSNAAGAVVERVEGAVGEGAVERVGTFWSAARNTWGTWWDSVPAKNRPWIIGATGVGIFAGTVLGLMLPAWSAGAVTALAGAAIWLPAALWLGMAWSVPGFGNKTPTGLSLQGLSAGGWIAVWLVIAVIGVACQWYGLMPGKAKGGASAKGKKKRKRKADADDED